MGTATSLVLAEFRASVSEYRAQVERLIEARRVRIAEALDAPFESALRAMRRGSRAGFVGLDPYARTIAEVLPTFRAVAGFAGPRLRELLLRTVRLLEQTALGEHPQPSEVSWLRTEAVAAALDAAWATHTRRLWIEELNDVRMERDAENGAQDPRAEPGDPDL
jgi:hypothetical protein